MAKKLRVAVLYGGPSIEHDTSLKSGEAVIGVLGRSNYEIVPVLIERSGQWSIEPEELKDQADLAFNTLRGDFGEDGTVQRILRDLRFPYIGSEALPSALALNKDLTAKILRAHGIRVPQAVLVDPPSLKSFGEAGLRLDFDLPVVVKPVNRGSSLGVSLVRDEAGFFPAVEKALNLSRQALIEEYVPGREIAALLIDEGDEEVIPLPLVEVLPGVRGFYDHYAKHTPHAVGLVAPAKLTREEKDLIEGIALAIYRIIDASGILEINLIKPEVGEPYVLEVNTIPSFAAHSPLAEAARAHGVSLTELFERIIQRVYAESS